MENKTYKQQDIEFIINEDTIIVKTKLQAFKLTPRNHYWKTRLRFIRMMIEIGEVRSLQELASWTKDKIDWVAIRNV